MGAQPPRACDGRSLRPFLTGKPPADWRQEAHWEYDFRSFAESRGAPMLGLSPEESAMIGQRGARYKLVQFTALPPLLFDLQEDPDEFTNLAEDPAHRDVLLAETQKLISWRMAHNELSLTQLRLTPEGVVDLG